MTIWMFELKRQFRQKRTYVSFFLLFFLGVYYTLQVASNFEPIDKINRPVINTRVAERQTFLENTTVDENTHFYVHYALSVFPIWNKWDQMRLAAIDDHDWRQYAEATSEWYRFSDEQLFANDIGVLRYDIPYYLNNNPNAKIDGHYDYQKNILKYQEFARYEGEVTAQALEEKTALQALLRSSETILPMALLFFFILGISDSFTRDQKHETLLATFPLRKSRRFLAKAAAGLAYGLSLLLPVMACVFLYSFTHEVGRLDYPVAVYWTSGIEVNFVLSTLGNVLLRCLALYVLFLILGFLFAFLLNKWFSSQIISAMFSLLLLVSSNFYLVRGGGAYNSWHFFPTSFVSIGKVVLGRSWFDYYDPRMRFDFGVRVLLAWIVSLTGLLLLTYLIEGRRKKC
ncbi:MULTISPECIES: Tat pathway signal sequence domain protein [Enterococcus]|uniref:Tat pathway signal sequence domain protein n=1 Tax=Enterococcus TaxID=1350 RepID=UPI00089076DF|nr:Tat pathway signal sequence domain protein [Enterococcus casseliflavus]AYJ45879.1 Tat pathway signal sequence domain protein [Enterococcus casseliflavus]MCD4963198.1 Tat pathway signal sequence domain protein [Enterococcus casseliflavus]MDT2974309.1 Tat pathway signal sequence domain protein [Enterococcus casseliflavus]SDK46773.1 hypothetical protein SAMN05216513_107130 [Enterococcus casseliflavus]